MREFEMVSKNSELLESARKIKKMRVTLTQIQDHVIQKIEQAGEGHVPKSWNRKVSSPTTSQEHSKLNSPALILNRLFSARDGGPYKFQESAREPHPFSNDLIINAGLSSRDAYF